MFLVSQHQGTWGQLCRLRIGTLVSRGTRGRTLAKYLCLVLGTGPVEQDPSVPWVQELPDCGQTELESGALVAPPDLQHPRALLREVSHYEEGLCWEEPLSAWRRAGVGVAACHVVHTL